MDAEQSTTSSLWEHSQARMRRAAGTVMERTGTGGHPGGEAALRRASLGCLRLTPERQRWIPELGRAGWGAAEALRSEDTLHFLSVSCLRMSAHARARMHTWRSEEDSS